MAAGTVREVKVTQAYRFALDPTPAQERALWSHAGASRFAWNWGLAACRTRYDTEGKWWSGPEMHKLWNTVKKADPALGWWGENSKCVYQEAFRDLDRALRDYDRARKGQRKGRRLGFPKHKKRGRCRDSFRLTGVLRCARGAGGESQASPSPNPGLAGRTPVKQEPGTAHAWVRPGPSLANQRLPEHRILTSAQVSGNGTTAGTR
ncbi:helix-turn-helix domain-containing protein [Actinomadura adrarensis]|uniref:Helix-turn-helix domain-containing protein n=1 Tax=Actinomadura adrarensis TaxID=1819600 RepID=A0ABW3CQ53_9ACTN